MGLALAGLIFSVLLIVSGSVVLGRRGELSFRKTMSQGTEMDTEVEAGFSESGVGAGASVDVFRGVRRGFEFYGEKDTAEILSMISKGRLREAWPWAAMSLGTLMIFVWLPLLIGILAGLQDTVLFLLVGLSFLAALFAAFPRRRSV